MYEIQRNDELQHYGVIGMKWGVRRARRSGTTYQYKSHGTKKYEKKATKAKTDADRKYYEHKAKRSAKLDKKLQDVAENMSTGKVVVGSLLVGPWGLKTYALTKASSPTSDRATNRIVAAGATVATSLLSAGQPLGNIAVNALIRSSYSSVDTSRR